MFADPNHLLYMKNKIIKSAMAIAIALSLSGCGKSGEIGPQGNQGDKGQQGDKGDKGQDGNRIFSGNLPPEITIGNVGDFYINLINMDFYGPKAQSGWGEPSSLKPNSSGASYYYNTNEGDWKKISNYEYELELSIPELDNIVFEDGFVLVSILERISNPRAFHLIPGEINGFKYSASYSVGKLHLNSEYLGPGPMPYLRDLTIKVILADSKIGN